MKQARHAIPVDTWLCELAIAIARDRQSILLLKQARYAIRIIGLQSIKTRAKLDSNILRVSPVKLRVDKCKLDARFRRL